jgi:thiopeptide-type bacteriocin biosynthesis protein
MQPWLSYHLYPLENIDVFLVRGVRPFLEREIWSQKGRRAFFTRYDDEKGRHIRLRLRGAEEADHESLVQAFHEWFADRGKALEVPYAPEPERFGGEAALPWAEEYFHVSTRVVLDRLQRQPYTYGDSLFDALRLHTITAFAAGLEPDRAAWYFGRLCDQWLPLFFEPENGQAEEPGAFKAVREQFEKTFEQQQEELRLALRELWDSMQKGKFDTEQPEWLRWLRGNEAILQELGEQLERALPSLLHLTNNRLGVGNQDEVFLNYILSKAI